MSHSNNNQTGKLPKFNKRATGLQDTSEELLNEAFPDYPLYPENEDIYSNYSKEEDIDIEHPYISDRNKPKDIQEGEVDSIVEGLDIPGSELDDQQEYIGSEDEENNYYSLGGDRHEDLDEDTSGDI